MVKIEIFVIMVHFTTIKPFYKIDFTYFLFFKNMVLETFK
jgi:hypothetical protein